MRSIKSVSSATTSSTVVFPESTTTGAATTSGTIPPAMQKSPWHSPVPYLFGGLAAMLGLIAFALLILACSYWKLSGQLNGNGEEDEDEDDLESGDGSGKKGEGKKRVVYQEQFVVILAGDDKPTCLATPVMTTKANSLNNDSTTCEKLEQQKETEMVEKNRADEQQSVVIVERSSEESRQLHDDVHDDQLHSLHQEQPEETSS